MEDFTWKTEKTYQQEFEERHLELPNGEMICVDMQRVHWNWYDRVDLHSKAKRHPNAGNGLLFEEIEKTGPKTPREAGEFLSEVMVEHVFAQVAKGVDPFETPGQRAWRRSVEWKLKQARKSDSDEAA